MFLVTLDIGDSSPSDHGNGRHSVRSAGTVAAYPTAVRNRVTAVNTGYVNSASR